MSSIKLPILGAQSLNALPLQGVQSLNASLSLQGVQPLTQTLVLPVPHNLPYDNYNYIYTLEIENNKDKNYF